jgi:hypothetical protein
MKLQLVMSSSQSHSRLHQTPPRQPLHQPFSIIFFQNLTHNPKKNSLSIKSHQTNPHTTSQHLSHGHGRGAAMSFDHFYDLEDNVILRGNECYGPQHGEYISIYIFELLLNKILKFSLDFKWR